MVRNKTIVTWGVEVEGIEKGRQKIENNDLVHVFHRRNLTVGSPGG